MSHYDTLEISPHASPEVVRAAYKSLIQRFHPDRHPGDSAGAARAAAITEAYDVLSDATRRAAYDDRLAAGRMPPGAHAAAQPYPGGRPEPARRAPAAGPGPATWALGLAAVAGVVWGAVWLASPKTDARSELLSIRAAYARGGVPEAELRELYARKEALQRLTPELQAAAAVERAANQGGRTIDLLDTPLVVRLANAELTIPRLRVVLGTFDTAGLRDYVEKNRERLVRNLAESLAHADATRLGPGGDGYLKALVAGALAQGTGTRPEEDYPSTFFESPGRHGAVEILLPEAYTLRAS